MLTPDIERIRQGRQRGFSITELAVVLAIIAILAIGAAPLFVSYYQNAVLRSGAEVVSSFLMQGRQLAIRTNLPVCPDISSSRLVFRQNSCGGAAWVGVGTDASGFIAPPQGVTVAVTSGPPVFNYLGAATPAGSYTVTNPRNGGTLRVTVASTGRISVGP